MQKLLAMVVLAFLTGATVTTRAATLVRESPEFIIAQPGRAAIPLSSFRGKVVVMEFLFSNSEHCLRVARMLSRLQGELGSQGLQPVGIVFDPPGMASSGRQFLAAVTDYLKLAYPLGYASKEQVDIYLNRDNYQVLNIPQIVVIDRTGMIRAASGGLGGDPALEDESSLSNLIRTLLKESTPKGGAVR
jgi:peroxiredoxin